MPLANPLAIRFSTCFCVSSSITGGPGTVSRAIAKSSCPGGPTDSHRKSPSSGNEMSARTSKPILLVQKSRASSWSCTHSCAFATLIVAIGLSFSRIGLRRQASRGSRVCLLETCCLGTRVGPQDAARHPGRERRGWLALPVGGGRLAEGALEAGGERAEAQQSDRDADLPNGPIGHSQQRGRPLQAPGEQIVVRRLAEGGAELPAEVRLREAGGRRHVGDPNGLRIAGVG